MEDNNPEDMVVFPEGTDIFPVTEDNEVIIKFPTQEDAIIYYEFVKLFHTDGIQIEIVSTS